MDKIYSEDGAPRAGNGSQYPRNCSAKLPRSRMLKRREDISRRLKTGMKFRGKYLTLVTVSRGLTEPLKSRDEGLPGQKPAMTRMAALVRKSCGRAHDRVRLKRLTREFFRLNQASFQEFESVIFSLERQVENEKDFKRELRELLNKAVSID